MAPSSREKSAQGAPRGSQSRPPAGTVEAYREGVAELVARLGEQVAERLSAGGGSREDALRGPTETLLQGAGRLLGHQVVPVGEHLMAQLGVRPDYAIDVDGARVGLLELKAPGTGVPDGPGWGRSDQERRQWERLSALPNVVYSDGSHWALYHAGTRVMSARCRPGNLERAGARLAPDGQDLADLMIAFLQWDPQPPKSLTHLIDTIARLCRVLRDEIVDTLTDERAARRERLFSGHVADWRQWLFPNLTEPEFADSYAQTITFGLLLARREGIDFSGLDAAAIGERLAKRHLLLGRALTVLTSRQGRGGGVEDTSVVLQTLRRVISVVDWDAFADHDESAHLLYERFLEAYDPTLRRQSGSYYTPEPLTTFMVRFVHHVLRSRLDLARGLADPRVVTVDPAMGTGSFLLGVVDEVARTVREDGGDVPASLRELLERLVGFERQIGPFAVAELKLHHALARWGTEVADADLSLLVADTLDDPAVELPFSGEMYRPLSDARAQANEIKSSVKVTVVIGNPPYRERARALGGEIVARARDGSTVLDAFRPPDARLAYKLHNLATYFWRWATRKVFEANPDDRSGVVAFVTTSAYVSAPAFAGMREYLRRNADEGWIIDLSPEGHQPPVPTRVFPGVQQPICVGVFVRRHRAPGADASDQRASVRYRSLTGRHDSKLAMLEDVSPDGEGWAVAARDWGAPFTPVQDVSWLQHPAFADLMPWRSQGVKSNRTWVWAPDRTVLQHRWQRLVSASASERGVLMKETGDRDVQWAHGPGDRHLRPLISEAATSEPSLRRLAARAFDRQWMIDDPRVIDRPRPFLVEAHSEHQLYATVHGQAVTSGPAVVFTELIPDTHHTAGRGGVVVPLLRGVDGPNIAPGLLRCLSERLGESIGAEGLLAYIAALASHPGYTSRFRGHLATPDLRVPLSGDITLWRGAEDLGYRVLWLHTFGERAVDAKRGRPLRLRGLSRPKILHPISPAVGGAPDSLDYDARTKTLIVGDGQLGPVDSRVWDYDVCGSRVVRSWFDYRRRSPRGRRSSPLDDIVAERWTTDFTEELRTLLGVLTELAALEPSQDRLLSDVLNRPLITVSDLGHAGVLPVPTVASRPPSIKKQPGLL
jgi:hypothetical protein